MAHNYQDCYANLTQVIQWNLKYCMIGLAPMEKKEAGGGGFSQNVFVHSKEALRYLDEFILIPKFRVNAP